MRTFFTSDSHFGHDNIIHHCNRPCKEHPFRDSAQMDRAMMAEILCAMTPFNAEAEKKARQIFRLRDWE